MCRRIAAAKDRRLLSICQSAAHLLDRLLHKSTNLQGLYSLVQRNATGFEG